MPPLDFTELLNALTIQAQLGPLQWGVIGLTIVVVKLVKAHPDIPTPKYIRPYLYLLAGVLLNVGLELYLGSFNTKTFLAQQAIIWVTTLGLRHLIDAPKAAPDIYDPRSGRNGDPRRP